MIAWFAQNTARDVIRDTGVGANIPDGDASNTQIDSILEAVFLFAGFVALVFVVIGGFRYVISAGNPQKTAQAKDTIIYSIIGLVIAIMAFAIVRFVVGAAS